MGGAAGPTGFFVTFEGPEGGGKSTQAERLTAALARRGFNAFATREPGGTRAGETIRQLLLRPGGRPLAAWTEALLFTASRAQLVAEVIRPRLEAGEVVVCDRFIDSTLAYQGSGRGLDLALLRSLQQAATGALEPGLTILLDLPVEEGLARIPRQALDRLDREAAAFHQRVRDAYLEMAGAEPSRWVVLDARAGADALAERVFQTVLERLGRAGVRPAQQQSA